MKKLKFLLFLAVIVLVSGCVGAMKPREKAEEFLNRYIKNDTKLIEELDEYLNKQNLSNDQRDKYKKIILDEYATIEYVIKDEYIEGDDAKVEVAISVKDLYKASSDAEAYLTEHPTDFYTNDKYDKDKFTDYKLERMKTQTEKVNYNIIIDLINISKYYSKTS